MNIEIRDDGQATEIILSGPFTFNDSSTFKEVIYHLRQKGAPAVNVNLDALDFIDSDGLGMLLLLRDVSKRHQFPLSLSHAKGHVKKMFELWHFDRLFTLA